MSNLANEFYSLMMCCRNTGCSIAKRLIRVVHQSSEACIIIFAKNYIRLFVSTLDKKQSRQNTGISGIHEYA